MRRLIWIVVLVIVGLIAVLAAGVTLLTLSMLHLMDRTDARVCGLAAVRRSPVALRLVGSPVAQRGFTGGSSSSENGEMTESVRFTVTGPRGEAFVASEGHRSPLDSHLVVRIGRDQRSDVIYSGPFDCPELHRTAR
ncbi:MAG TPA: hypothetical protein VN909_00575 [Candidatus Dormibacteraeota bacterium]|nr:hypothetical protein [Candidatus Dormibacteraeota bacterium]